MKNRLPCVLVFLFAFYSSSHLLAQAITGKVIDAQSRQPVRGATVIIQDSDRGTTTDENGQFSIETGQQQVNLVISSVGYLTRNVVANPGNFVNISLETNVKELDEVVITAFESDRRLMETPGTIGRITAQDIERFDKTSPLQVMNTMPGVKVESTTIGRYTVRIRGGSQGIVGHNDNYKTYWNGIPLTRANGRNPLGDFDLGSIGSMNIIRGPAGSIYGAGLGGVMLIENKTASQNQTEFSLEGLRGSYGLHRYSAAFATGGEKGDIRVQYANLGTDGYREEAQSSNSLFNVFARVFPSEKQTISVLGFYTKRSYGIPGTLTEEAMLENPRQASFSTELDNGLNFSNTMFGISNDYRWNPRWRNITSLSYQSQESDFLIGNAFFVAADRTLQHNISLRSATSYSFDLFSFPSQLTFGFEYNRAASNTNFFENGFDSNIYSATDANVEQNLGFAQLEINLPQDFLVTLAGSYNYYSLDFQEHVNRENNLPFYRSINQFSPRLAVVKPLNRNLVLHGNISHGFTPPQSDAFYNTDGSVNLAIGATHGFNKEIGIRGNWLSNRLSLDLVGYRLDLIDVIVPKVFSNVDGIDLVTNENAGAIDQQGIELAAQYTLIDNPNRALSFAKLWASYIYNDYVFEEYNTLGADAEGNIVENDFSGKTIPGTHRHIFVAGLDLTSRFGFYMNNTFSYYDGVYLNNANTVRDNSYNLLDMRLGYKTVIFQNLQLNVFGGVNNTLDALYSSNRTYNAFLGAYFDPSPGRNYYTGVNLKYLF